MVAGAEECLFGVFESFKKEIGQQFGGQFGFEQSAGMVNHIESAASKMVVSAIVPTGPAPASGV